MNRAWPLTSCLIALAFGEACSTRDGDGGPVDAAITADAVVARPDAPPDAPVMMGTTCPMKNPVVQLIYTCIFEWSQCTGTGGTAPRTIDCRIQSVGSLKFSLCDCIVGGVQQQQFTSTTICASASWAELETTANTECGWDLK